MQVKRCRVSRLRVKGNKRVQVKGKEFIVQDVGLLSPVVALHDSVQDRAFRGLQGWSTLNSEP